MTIPATTRYPAARELLLLRRRTFDWDDRELVIRANVNRDLRSIEVACELEGDVLGWLLSAQHVHLKVADAPGVHPRRLVTIAFVVDPVVRVGHIETVSVGESAPARTAIIDEEVLRELDEHIDDEVQCGAMDAPAVARARHRCCGASVPICQEHIDRAQALLAERVGVHCDGCGSDLTGRSFHDAIELRSL